MKNNISIIDLRCIIVTIAEGMTTPYTQADIVMKCTELLSKTDKTVDDKTLKEVVADTLGSMYEQGLIDNDNGILTKVED